MLNPRISAPCANFSSVIVPVVIGVPVGDPNGLSVEDASREPVEL